MLFFGFILCQQWKEQALSSHFKWEFRRVAWKTQLVEITCYNTLNNFKLWANGFWSWQIFHFLHSMDVTCLRTAVAPRNFLGRFAVSLQSSPISQSNLALKCVYGEGIKFTWFHFFTEGLRKMDSVWSPVRTCEGKVNRDKVLSRKHPLVEHWP